MLFSADIDIDVATRTDRNSFGVQAIIYDADTQQITPHPSGHYVECGMHEDTGNPGKASVDYETAEELGFTKIDLLRNTSYDYFTSKEDVLKYLHREPEWTMLEESEICECLPQIAGHTALIQRLKPKSIEDLADILALLRPGKAYLVNRYAANKAVVRRELYKKVPGVYFKKSHAIAYASMIVCVMNKIAETIEQDAL